MIASQQIRNRLTSIGDSLRRWSERRWFLLTIIFLLTLAVGTLVRNGGNPSALIRFGGYYVEQNESITPPGALRYIGNEANGGNGYDGQIFYYYARTLLITDAWPQGFSFAYRAPRSGYPLLAAPLALLQYISPPLASWAVALALPVIQILLLALATRTLARLLPERQRWTAAAFACAPFLGLSFLLTVSDGIAVALCVIGFGEFRRAFHWPLVAARPYRLLEPPANWRAYLLAWLCFSVAILAKESSLFFLFPLGLAALFSRRLAAMAPIALALGPAMLWQLYLRSIHGMAPAGILAIFLSPFDGILGMLRESWLLAVALLNSPRFSGALDLVKQSAKLLLFLYYLAALRALASGKLREGWPFRLILALTLLSISFADFYYFWSVFDNVARMFAFTIPALIFLRAESPAARTGPAFALLFTLTIFVALRSLLLVPHFPSEIWFPYEGPSYAGHAPHPPGAW